MNVTYRYLVDLTTYETAALVREQQVMFLLPTAAVEQHGGHLPLGTDNFIANSVISALAAASPADDAEPGRKGAHVNEIAVIILPPVPVSLSQEHMDSPGSLTLSLRTFSSYIEDICGSLASLQEKARENDPAVDGGVWPPVLVAANFHGGNSSLLSALTRTVRADYGVIMFVHNVYEKSVMAPFGSAFDYHAGEAETSIMLAEYPEKVRKTASAPSVFNTELLQIDQKVNAPWYSSDISADGVIGFPEKADRETGKHLVSALCKELTESISSAYAFMRNLPGEI